MDKKRNVLIVGGDLRQVHIANLMSEKNKVGVLGFDEHLEFKSNVKTLISTEDLKDFIKTNGAIEDVVMPVQPLNDDGSVNVCFSSRRIIFADLLKLLDKDTVIFAGKISSLMKEKLQAQGMHYYDYLEREELSVMNAIPTAEGTIQIIMEEMPVTIYGMNVFIVGSGRIAKVLRRDLIALGASVTTVSRKCSDMAWSEIDGSYPVHLKDLDKTIHNADVVVNTVPVKVLDEKVLSQINSNTLLIDLASKPGGVDFEEAKRLGIKTIWALSLPGKTSPITAGEIIYNTIVNIIENAD